MSRSKCEKDSLIGQTHDVNVNLNHFWSFSGLMNTMKIEARREGETSQIDYYFISNEKLIDVIHLVTLSCAKLENTFDPNQLIKTSRLEDLPFKLREKINGDTFSNQVCVFELSLIHI